MRTYLEEYEIGDAFETPRRTITEADIVQFSMLSGDWNPLHSDAEFANSSFFGQRIAHGLLVLSVGGNLWTRLPANTMTPKSFIAFYGFHEVRFPNPVFIGDTIGLRMSVKDIDFKDESKGVLIYQNEIIKQDQSVCCSYSSLYLCGRNPKR